MINKKSSLKSGLVFSAAVAGSIIGNYHKAYALSCTGVTATQAFGGLVTCYGEAGDQTINITGDGNANTIDFSINNQADGQDENSAIKVKNNIIANTNNALNVTLSAMQIQSDNAAGFLFRATQVSEINGFNGDNDFFLTINEDVSISTTSDGYGGFYNFKEAVSIANSSDKGSSIIIINGDVTTRGVGTNPGFDDAVKIYKFAEGNSNITIGGSSSIKAYDGGDALYSYGGVVSDVAININGDIFSEKGSAVVVLKGDSSVQTFSGEAGNITVDIGSTSTITSKQDAVFLFISETNSQNANAKTIDITVSGDINSSNGNTISIDGSSRFDGKRDTVTVTAGANLTNGGLTAGSAVINVKDNFSNINLEGGANFSSTADADIVKLSMQGSNGFAIKLASSTLQTSIHDNDVSDHVTDFSDTANHPTIGGTQGIANHTVNVSGNVEIVGNISAGGNGGVGDDDILNLNRANLTLNKSSVAGFEAINVTEDSNLSINQNSLISGKITVGAGKSLNLSINSSDIESIAADAVIFNDQNDSLVITGTSKVIGNIDGGAGVDTLNLVGTLLTLDNAAITNFENLNITGASGVDTLNLPFDVSARVVNLSDGSLTLVYGIRGIDSNAMNMTISNSSLIVNSGNAINFANQNDSLTIQGITAINNNVSGGAGSDTLNLSNATLTLNNNASFTAFETLNITGANTVNGAFNVSAATTNLSNGSLAVAGGVRGVNGSAVNMTINNASLTSSGATAISFANQNDSLTLQGITAITGNVDGGAGAGDSLTLDNSTLTLGANSQFVNFETLNVAGNNIINGNLDLTGFTSFNSEQGSLIEMNGTITAQVLQLNSGLTLNGNFTLNGDLIAGNGSTLSAGAMNSGIGTLTVTGNVIFKPNSTLLVDVNGNTSDEVIVNGAVNILDGAKLSINPIHNGSSGSARMLTATGGITGSFSNVLTASGSSITLVYSANNLSFNYVSLNTDALSSQIQSSVDNSILFSDTLNKQIARGAFNSGRNFWMRNIYRNRDIDSSSSAAGFKDKAYGVAFGSETDINEAVKVGFAAASIDGSVNVANNQGSRDSNSFFASAYANYKTANNLFASLALTLGYHDNKNSRAVTNSGVQSYARSSSSDKDIGLNFQTGKKYTIKEVWNIMPKISLSYIKTMAGKIDEREGGDSQISVKDYNFSTLKIREAVRVERSNYLKFSNIEFSPYFELGLAQERAIGDRKISGSFVAANQNFSTKLKNNNRNFITGNVGFNMQINKDVSAFVSYENAVSDKETRKDFNAGVSVKF